MVENRKEISKKEKKMDKELKHGQMVENMKEISKKEGIMTSFRMNYLLEKF